MTALITAMGLEIAREMKRLGVHVSFSPVVDVNNNPANPVINDRSFGEDRELVARKGIAYMRGLQQGGVIATAKHFPGHGDTDTDSHYGLPLIAHSRTRLDSLELYPFQRMVEEGIAAMMVGAPGGACAGQHQRPAEHAERADRTPTLWRKNSASAAWCSPMR
jgi:beta-N-acetylhexosaminidase